jgi:hypothetical protein
MMNSDRLAPNDLWTLIGRLAEMNVFLHHTDHLSDVELHDWLTRFLDEEIPEIASLNTHVDVIGSGSDEDTALWLRHYATEEERNEWRGHYPSEQIPPRQPTPYDRDRFLSCEGDIAFDLHEIAAILITTP